MIYTYQELSDSWSFSTPEGTDVHHASNKIELARALDNWGDTHEQVGTDKSYACLLVWRGRHDDVTDIMPDFEVGFGPRGGAVIR